MHFSTIFRSFKNKDMLKRIGVILGIIVAYRLLAQIPVPMGDASTFKEAVSNLLEKSDFSNFLNLISGGGLASFSIILVGLSPYITGSIIMQLLSKAIPRLEELSEDGETGRRKINQWTRMLTVPLAIVQSIAYIFILYQSTIAANISTDFVPSMGDWVLSVTAMTAGSLILMWMGELITEQGIGNGISTLIFASIISQLPTTMAQLGSALFDTSEGTLQLFGGLELPVNPTVFWIILGFAVAMVVVIYLLVKLNEAQRIITINYAKRVHGNSSYGGIKSILPIKLIAAGVIPVIFATAFLSLPALVGQVITSFDSGNEVGAWLTTVFSAPSAANFTTQYPDGITGQWFVYPIMYFLLVFAFTYFYTSIIFNTKEIADNLQKQGGFIEGVRPGIKTADYLAKVVRRLDLFGALALGLIAMLPFATDYIFIMTTGAPLGLSISGTGLLIVVTVALENLRSVDSRALMITYDDFKNESQD
ncbi:preprotein translocase subunit SecY [Candidatus Saccharibacteria bacterium]|nr:preprotein translocase subunit SecY [Candidatus Saccharibacteria bacterium]MBR0424276.1 preprotein translocase subunit SecY [Candidatus Saccharibacteria bacterium]